MPMHDLQQSLSVLADSYSLDFAVRESQRALGAGLQREEREFSLRFFRAPAKLLDIGCGTGREAFAFEELGFDVTGIDISAAMVAHAKKNARKRKAQVRFMQTDGITLPFPDNSFDCVFAIGMLLGYITGRENRARFLGEIRRVLKPRGIVVLNAENRTVLSDSFDAALKLVYPFIETGYNWPRVQTAGDYAKHCLAASFWKWWLVLKRHALANSKRKAAMFLQGKGHACLEPGDWTMSINSRPTLLHQHSRAEVLRELRTAGFETIECKSRTEVTGAPFGSPLFSPFMSSHYFAARK